MYRTKMVVFRSPGRLRSYRHDTSAEMGNLRAFMKLGTVQLSRGELYFCIRRRVRIIILVKSLHHGEGALRRVFSWTIYAEEHGCSKRCISMHAYVMRTGINQIRDHPCRLLPNSQLSPLAVLLTGHESRIMQGMRN